MEVAADPGRPVPPKYEASGFASLSLPLSRPAPPSPLPPDPAAAAAALLALLTRLDTIDKSGEFDPFISDVPVAAVTTLSNIVRTSIPSGVPVPVPVLALGVVEPVPSPGPRG